MTIASEITRLQTAKAGIKTALEDKGVEVDSSATLDEYPGYIEGLSAGDVTNGVLQEMYAQSGAIDANTFVEFATGTLYYDKDLGTDEVYGDRNLSLAALDDTHLFVAYANRDGVVKSAVYTVSDTTITAGPTAIVSTAAANNPANINTVVLTPNEVLVVYLQSFPTGQSSANICSVSSSAITVESTMTFRANVNGKSLIVALDDTTAVGFYSNNSAAIQPVIFKIDGMAFESITVGNDIAGIATSQRFDAVALSNSKILLIMPMNTSNDSGLQCRFCTISGTQINYGTWHSLATNGTFSGRVFKAIALSENRVFVAVSYSSSYILYGLLCEISNDDVLFVRSIQLSTVGIQINTWFSVVPSPGGVRVLYGSSNRLYFSQVRFYGNGLFGSTGNQQISSRVFAGLVLGTKMGDKSIILYTFSTGTYQPTNAAVLQDMVIPSDGLSIGGLTKDNITADTPGGVWVLG